VLACSQKARQAGYTLAVQGDGATDTNWPMFDLAQIIRIDLGAMKAEQVHTLLHRKGYGGPSLLAASIDTHEQLDKALQLGVDYVQGFFFSEPQTSTHRALTTPQVVQLRFLSELSKPELDYETLENIIKSDVALMTHLLRYVNSSAMGLPRRITSVKQTLALLGERALRKWGSLVAITALGTGSPHELLMTSLVRARFCELLVARLHLEPLGLDAFLTGLFSTIDVMLHTPMEQALASLPVGDQVRSVLLGDRSSPLGMIYALVCAAERGAWGSVIELGHKLLLPQQEVAPLYYQTLRWIDEFYSPGAA
jgi:c-di-GMP-related signal transduction protein